MIDIFKWIKKYKKICRHKWEQLEPVSAYHDYSGFKVVLFRCKCKKCGKIELRKYW
nr:hypothetical protein [uncultured Mediterraneibacter sp.]